MSNKTIFLKRLSQNKVTLLLEDATNAVMPAKWFTMTEKSPRIAVPAGYALSIFANSTLESMMKRNIFEVENIKDLIELAQEHGLLHRDEEEIKELAKPKRPDEMLMSILKGGNEAKIKELFASQDKHRALQLTIANQKSLSMQVVQLVEDIVKIAIIEE